jgi:hypothetical protein
LNGAVQGGSSSIRTATHALVHSLYSEMGSLLMDKAQADPDILQIPSGFELIHFHSAQTI